MSSLATKIVKLTKKYGISWVIINQCLGWISYIIIYFLLEKTSVDVVGW